MNEELLTITDIETKTIIMKDIEEALYENEEEDYYLYNYHINDMKITCEITQCSQNSAFMCNMWHEPIHKFKKILLRRCFLSLSSLVDFLLTEFRRRYKYSKITDNFEDFDYISDNEKQKLAFNYIRSGNNLLSELSCCVCYECCFTETSCKHKICRICVGKLQQKVCPLCKQTLN